MARISSRASGGASCGTRARARTSGGDRGPGLVVGLGFELVVGIGGQG